MFYSTMQRLQFCEGAFEVFRALKESLMNSLDFRHPMIRFPFAFLCIENALETHKNTGTTPTSQMTVAGWILWQWAPPCLRAITATALLVKATEKIVVGSCFCTSAYSSESLLNSYHAQHFSASHLTSYEVLLLTVLT